MKENIYTIPVVEAFQNGGECPVCKMYESLTQNAIDFMLGEAYMDEFIRTDTNKVGFCKAHLEQLFNQKNRLGLSLMMQSHMHEVNVEMKRMFGEMREAKGGGLFKKAAESKSAAVVKYIRDMEKACYVCNRIDDMLHRYVDTIFFLWKKDDDIKNLIRQSKGFCYNHYALLLETGEKKLSGKEFDEFLNITIPLMIENFAVLEQDLDWFIKKYDYRFAKEPWKNSQFALQRTIKKMQSIETNEG